MRYPNEFVHIIAEGKHAVIPTDTIYGVVCAAQNRDAVEGLYRIKQRTPTKPYIVLISDIEQIRLFDIDPTQYTSVFDQYWPGSVSIIMPCPSERCEYLHRGTQSIAFRLPANDELRTLIRKTGPLVAPSANPEGKLPATTIVEAKAYFGDQIAYYGDGGHIQGNPSSILSIGADGEVTKLR